MLQIKNLNKSYGKTRVLTDINLELEENKIYGLLGRNGVGKTTLLNIIGNQIKGDSGEVKYMGQGIYENPLVMEEICLVREKGIPADDDRVKKIFTIARVLYKNWDEEYKEYLVKEFNLNVNKKYSKLSRGNQTIVGLIIGLASRSKVTLFDEPSLGLDAAYRYRFYDILLEDIQKNQRTIIISTHLIDEVTNLFEEIIILKDEEVFIKDEVSFLMEKGYFLNGKAEVLMPIARNKNIIHKEDFGSSIIIGVFDDISKEERTMLREKNIEISNIPLQKLFVYLTENSKQKEVL